MSKIVQGTVSRSYGGLEMVVQDLHLWLLKNQYDAHVFVLQNTPLHQRLQTLGAANVLVIRDGWQRLLLGPILKTKFDSPDTGFLFHRQQILKLLWSTRFQGKVSMLSHILNSVNKKDPAHRLLFAKVDQWMALTPTHRENLIQTLGIPRQKTAVIPNSVDGNRFQARSNQRPLDLKATINIGVVGRLDPQKGQDTAIKALRLLRDQGLDVKLHFYGENTLHQNSYDGFLKKLARKLNVIDKICFEGFIGPIEDKVSALDIVWVPSHCETFGRCIIEAMACGIPVIASNAGGVPHIINNGKNGLLFSTKNEFALATKTYELINDSLLQRRLRTSGLESVAALYSHDIVMRNLVELIVPMNAARPTHNHRASAGPILENMGSNREISI